MLVCPQVALPKSIPWRTCTPFRPVPLAVLPLRLPRKSASMAMGTPGVMKALFVIVGDAAFCTSIPMLFWLNELLVTVGLEDPLMRMEGAVLLVSVVLTTLTEAFPVATSIIPISVEPP